MTPEPWFAPKSNGYGAGMPIHRNGWILLGAYVAGLLLSHLLAVFVLVGFGVQQDRAALLVTPVWLLVVLMPATLAVVMIARARTQGGWRWRWGGREGGPPSQ